MATVFSQDGHFLRIVSPLGPDKLILASFEGKEALSKLYEFDLELLSSEASIDPKDLIGHEVTLTVGAEDRHFHGVVVRFVAGAVEPSGLRQYRARMVPDAWYLKKTSDCRVYQEMTVPDIVEDVLRGHGCKSFQSKLRGTYKPLTYCVQYRETAFQFISRLLEDAGIYYYFQHEEKRHVMVLADDKFGYEDCAESRVKQTSGNLSEDHISAWSREFTIISGRHTYSDFDFESPKTKLESSAPTVINLAIAKNLERFDYPGHYTDTAAGEARAQLWMEEEEAQFDIATGSSTCRSFTPGGKFTISEHESKEEVDKAYAILSIQHSAREGSVTGGGSEYQNTFRCLSADTPYRPLRVTPRPLVGGPQTALVVGPSGEEIHTDKFGRIKVQFPWDRLGDKNEKSSCWVRVSQGSAGKGWGSSFLPRVGQEVIVSFIGGDPDQPIVTGSVYNGDQTVVYDLPANRTQSGIKTRSSKSGGKDNFNELRFEDKKDSEEIYLHAEKDFKRVVEDADTLEVLDGDRTITIKKGAESITITEGKREATLEQGDDLVTLKKGNRTVKLDLGNAVIDIGAGNHTIKLGAGKSSIEAMQGIELKVGANSIKVDQKGITLKGIVITIEGTATALVKSPMTTIKGDGVLAASGGILKLG